MLSIRTINNRLSNFNLGTPRSMPYRLRTLGEWAPPDASAVIVNNAKVVFRTDPEWMTMVPVDDSSLAYVTIPGVATTIATLFLIAVYVAVLAPETFTGAPPSAADIGDEEEERSSAAYGFDSVRNSFANGAVRPVTFGEMRVGGQVLMAFRRGATNKSQVLNVLIGLSDGPIEQIGRDSGTNYSTDQTDLETTAIPSGLMINGVEASKFSDVKVSLRMGADTQTVITGFEESVIEYDQNFRLDKETFKYPTKDPINAVEVNIEFPGGLYDQFEGSRRMMTCKVRVSVIALDEITVVKTDDFIMRGARSNTPMYFTHRIAGLNTGKYIIHVERRAPKPPGWTRNETGRLMMDQMRVISILEVRCLALTHPGMALLALKIRASEQLHGKYPTVTQFIKGRKVITDESVSDTDLKYTRSPAWVMEFILIDQFLGGGHTIARADIDDQSGGSFRALNAFTELLIPAYTGAPDATITVLDYTGLAGNTITLVINTVTTVLTEGVEWTASVDNDTTATSIASAITAVAGSIGAATAAVVKVTMAAGFNFTGTTPITTNAAASDLTAVLNAEKRFLFNGTFDRARRIWDSAKLVGAMCRSAPFKGGNLIKVAIEQAKPFAQTLGMGNIEKESFTKIFNNPETRNNWVKVKFRNALKEFDNDFANAQTPGLNDTTGSVRQKEYELIGCTSATQARRHAHYLLRHEQMIPREFEMDSGVEMLTLEPGDVPRLAHDSLDFGFSGRILANAGGNVTLDQSITFVADLIYVFTEQLDTDDTVQSVEFTMPAGATDTIPTAKLTGMTATIGIKYIISELKTHPQAMFLRQVQSTGNGYHRRLVGFEYNPDVYTDDAEEREDTSFVPDLGDPPNAASNVRVTAETSNAKNESRITVEWDAAATPPTPSGYAIYHRFGSQDAWIFADIVDGTTLELRVDLGAVGDFPAHGSQVTFLVQTRTEDGQFTALASAPTVKYVIKRKDGGQTRPKIPANVTGIGLQNVSGNDAELFWTAVTKEVVYADGFGADPQVAPQTITPDAYQVRVGAWHAGPKIYGNATVKTVGSPLALKSVAVPRTLYLRAKEDSYFSPKAAKIVLAAGAHPTYPVQKFNEQVPVVSRTSKFVAESGDVLSFIETGRMENLTPRQWPDVGEEEETALIQIDKEQPVEWISREYDLLTQEATWISWNLEVLPFFLLNAEDDDQFGTNMNIGPHGRINEDYINWDLWLQQTNADPPTPRTRWTSYRLNDRWNEDVVRTARHFRFRFKGTVKKLEDVNFTEGEQSGKDRYAKIVLRRMDFAFHRAT